MNAIIRNLVAERLTDNLKPLLGTVTAWAGTVTAWQAHIEWLFKVGASAAAIVVSIMTIRSLIRKERAEKKSG